MLGTFRVGGTELFRIVGPNQFRRYGKFNAEKEFL